MSRPYTPTESCCYCYEQLEHSAETHAAALATYRAQTEARRAHFKPCANCGKFGHRAEYCQEAPRT